MAAESPAASHLVYETPLTRIAREGLNLVKSLDDLTMQEVSRLSNLFHEGGDLFTRLGQENVGTLAAPVHSVRRLNDPQAGTHTRFWGASTNWYRGLSGVLGVFAGGFSGNPLTMLPVRPALSGEPWMVAADSAQMRKASLTSPALPLGLPVPTGLTTARAAAQSLAVAALDSSDGTQAANWTTFQGLPMLIGHQGTLCTVADVAGVTGNAVEVSLSGIQTATTGGSTAGAVPGFMGGIALPKALNLAAFGGGQAIDDQDLFHFNLRLNRPDLIAEVRIYMVCSPFTVPTPISAAPGVGAFPTWTLPGMGIGNFSPSAYLLTIRPSDYTKALIAAETLQDAADRVRTAAFLETFSDPVAAADSTSPSSETLAGTGIWTTFSELNLPPIRRGDFAKIGTAGQAGTDWSTITGFYLTIQRGDTTITVLKVAFDNFSFTGGSGPDTSEPGTQAYDYRVVNYDPRTGARSNGTAIQTGAIGAVDGSGNPLTAPNNIPDLTLDALRQAIVITPAAYIPDGAIRQEAFRRGGTLTDNWRFVGRNTANGGIITDTFADLDLANVDVVPVDHFQPVATVNAAGTTILAQPLPILFGPFDDGTVCGLGDPHQPGFLYASLPGEIDHWPSTGGFAIEVCAPSEELMNGCLAGGQGFVLSRERGYTVHTNLTGGAGIVATPSGCVPGLAARWGFCVGPGGVYYVARDGVRVTNGGDSAILTEALRSLFENRTVRGVAPIDFSVPAAIRLSLYDTDLWFLFQDTTGTRQCYVFSLVYRYWRPYAFAHPIAVVYQDETQEGDLSAEGALKAIFGGTAGTLYTYGGFTDDGTPIPFAVRTGAWSWGRPREEKLLGDLVLEADLQGLTLTMQTFLNTEAVANLAQTVTGGAGRTRFIFDPFGTTPQHARNVSIDLSGTAPTTAQAFLSFVGMGYVIQPEVTMNRATTWEPLSTTEGYCYGVLIDCDTGGTDRTILVEYDLAGVIATAAVLTVNSSGRHKQWYSWPVVHAQLVRLRPTGDCQPWMLFNVEWISTPEPPRIAGWDTNHEDLGDSYYTGLDLELDTFGQDKLLQVTVDGIPIPGSPFTVNRNGHLHQHLTFTPGRGHVYRFVGIDDNPGLLYSHKWIVEQEPLEQTNWNAPFTVYNSLSDKYLKGIVIEADTFGQDKAVAVEVDGVTLLTITPVHHDGRSVHNYTFPQVLGRVFRIIPTDPFPSRLYTAQPLFDEEPFALARWETQLLDFNLPGSGWGSLLSLDCCYKATAPVTLSVAVYEATGRLLQTLTGVDLATQTALLPSTSGAKQKRYIVFPANKGVLFKLIATSADASGVTIYKEESRMRLQPWSGGGAVVKLLGNDDLDPTREMTKAAVAAGRQGGAAR